MSASTQRNVTSARDVETHLRSWQHNAARGQPLEPVISSLFETAGLDDVAAVADSRSIVARHRHRDGSAPRIVVIGDHAIDELAPALPRTPSATRKQHLVGPGISSKAASLASATLGFMRAVNHHDLRASLIAISLGSRDSPLRMLRSAGVDRADAIIMTSAVRWHDPPGSLTTGARGVLVARISVSNNRSVVDDVFAGAINNPLTKLVELVSSLRLANGRIALANFYEKAVVPGTTARANLSSPRHDPATWISELGLTTPTGELSAIERASLWPTISVTEMRSDSANRSASPGSAVATVRIHLVPNQRPDEVERALRRWFADSLPKGLTGEITIVDSSLPYRVPDDSPVLRGQLAASATSTVAQIPAGGPRGAGEISYALHAPVGFAGVCTPTAGFGTEREEFNASTSNRLVLDACSMFAAVTHQIHQR